MSNQALRQTNSIISHAKIAKVKKILRAQKNCAIISRLLLTSQITVRGNLMDKESSPIDVNRYKRIIRLAWQRFLRTARITRLSSSLNCNSTKYCAYSSLIFAFDLRILVEFEMIQRRQNHNKDDNRAKKKILRSNAHNWSAEYDTPTIQKPKK